MGEKILNCNYTFKRFLSVVLVLSMVFTMAACGSEPPKPVLSDPNPQIITENIEQETIITETLLNETITEEIYLEEIVVAEDKISELLLEEETISEVLLCKSIYVPQDNIDEFSANSLTALLFGEDVDISSLLTKVAIGTGVIVTVVVFIPFFISRTWQSHHLVGHTISYFRDGILVHI